MNISTNNLTIGYGAHVVQSCLCFSLHEGEIVALLGPNGCGKTTFLRTMAGLLPQLSGTISPELNEKNMALVLTERLSLDNTSVHDVVAMGRYPYTSFLGTLTDKDEQIITQSLEAVGLSRFIDSPIHQFNNLSDGEKQRVLIAKALAQQTDLILLDEPTAHLDLPGRICIFTLLQQLAHTQGKTVLISTHELDLAAQLCDRIVLMHSGGLSMINQPLQSKHDRSIQDLFTKAFGMQVFEYIR